VTRSDLEIAFLAFLDAHGLPRIIWRQLHHHRATLAAELSALLAEHRPQHSRNRRTGR
jgi:hypothetical protein